ncbi:MAG: hypothetical protein H6Q76_1511 [Firmicutes bacterium]|nr:hypothetical protein [Bacillota bacterium]
MESKREYAIREEAVEVLLKQLKNEGNSSDESANLAHAMAALLNAK